MSKEQPPDGLPARVLEDGERDIAATGDLALRGALGQRAARDLKRDGWA